MTRADHFKKRAFDFAVAFFSLWLIWWIILGSWIIARWDTGASGFYLQTRVGRHGKLFRVVKLRTMRPVEGSTVTTAGDSRITPWGLRFRRWKIDELPQLFNVLVGQMSLVGPRPDVPGFLDNLEGEERALLDLRPGITGPASLAYHGEEDILASVADPERYNAEVIWPDKVRINLEYLRTWSFRKDLRYMWETVVK